MTIRDPLSIPRVRQRHLQYRDNSRRSALFYFSMACLCFTREVTTSSGQEAEQLAKRQKLDVAPAASEATGTSDQAQTVATGEGDVRVHSGTDAEGEILSQTTQLAEEDDEEDEDSVDYEEESDEEESEEDVDDLSDIAACLNRPPSPPSEPLGRRAPTSKKYEGLFMNGREKNLQ